MLTNETFLAVPSIVAMQALCEIASFAAPQPEASELREEAAHYRECMVKPYWRAHLAEPLFNELGGDDCRSQARLCDLASAAAAAAAAQLRAQVGE